jgi:hypothetical protein
VLVGLALAVAVGVADEEEDGLLDALLEGLGELD